MIRRTSAFYIDPAGPSIVSARDATRVERSALLDEEELALRSSTPERSVGHSFDAADAFDGHGERLLDGSVGAEPAEFGRLAVVGRAVPERAADARYARNEPIRRERLDHLAGLRVDFVDLRLAELTDEQVPVSEGHSALRALGRAAHSADDAPIGWTYDQDFALRELIEVLAIERGTSASSGQIEALHHLRSIGIEGDELVVSREPHEFSVEGDTVNAGFVEGLMLADDLGCAHDGILPASEGSYHEGRERSAGPGRGETLTASADEACGHMREPYGRDGAGGSNIPDVALALAGRALASGQPLQALGLVGRDESAVGLTMRGIAYAQLGDMDLARRSLERAVKSADDAQTRAHARAALVEIELSTGDPAPAARAARTSIAELLRLGDRRNAAMQRLVLARAEVLLGRLGEAQRAVAEVLATELTPDLRAVALLARAEIAIRVISTTEARQSLAQARRSLESAPHHLLARALVGLEQELSRPIARIVHEGMTRDADLFTIEEVSRGEVLLVDACRRITIGGRVTVPLARRPILFALLLELARAWPGPVKRDDLALRAFAVRSVNASHRSRLRVEVGRLRKLMDGLGAEPVATEEGYALASQRDVVVLLPPSDDDDARIAILLSDGAAWSARGLAEHAGISTRTAQRVLTNLVASGGAIRSGKGKNVRYVRPGTPIASRMLLLGLVPKT